jgi:hypothetical protein
MPSKEINKNKIAPRFTLGFTYYDEPELLKRQLEFWKYYPQGMEIFIVDDASPNYPAKDILKDVYFFDGPDIQLWEVGYDMGFNSHGCRNLIAKYAPTDWICFLDMDHLMNPSDVARIKRRQFNENKVYNFPTYHPYSNHYHEEEGINMALIHKDLFWEAGGYDESFTGYHMGDREFWDRVADVERFDRIQKEEITITVLRGKRQIFIEEDLGDIAIYGNEELGTGSTLSLNKPLPSIEELKGTIDIKLNFPHTKIL